ncbi:reverse transcriptase domain-containing protein [Tanacetum coccineum]
MTPIAVLMKTGIKLLNIARHVNTAHPKTTVYSARPMSCFSKLTQSNVKRPYQSRTSLTNKNFNQKVNTAKPKAVNTARPTSPVVNIVRANQVNAVKASTCWVWRPTKLNSASITFKRQNYIDAPGRSKHMTGNMSYLSDFKEFDGGYVTFGVGARGGRITGKGNFEDVYFIKELQFNLFSVSQMCDKKNSVLFTNIACFVLSLNFKLPDESQVLLKVPRKNNMYSVDMKNIVPKESLTCLVAKATLDEPMLWHRRLGHINFKTINKLVKDNLVRGLPAKHFENDQTCVSCLKGKFTWVFFLAFKDETSGILKNFITEIENLVDKKVKIIRFDNRTEYKNRVMNEFCEKKGIKREFSVARTPQQNDMVKALLLDKKSQAPTPVKAVEESCVTCGGAHSYRNYPATDGNVYRDNIQEYVSQAAAANFNQGNTSSGTLPSNTITNPKVDLKGITTQSGVAYQGPTIPTTSSSPPKVVERKTEVIKDTVSPTNNGSTKDVQPPVVQDQPQVPNSEPVVAPISAPMPNSNPSIPYPSRRNDERRREKANDQIEKFYEIFKDLSFEISLTDALILMPKFASTLKALIGNKEKLSEMDRTPLNEHCSAVILNKKNLSLLELTPTCMTLELADLVDFDADPRVPLILGRSFLKTGRALIDVYEGELTLRVGKEAITFNLDQTSRYSSNYDDMTANRIDVIEMACEEYSQEVLGFSDVIASGNPTPYYDPIVSTSSPTLTPFGDSDFLLEEVDAFLALEDDLTSPEVDDSYYDPEGDILLLESFLNDDPSPPPNQGNYLPEIQKELKVCEAKTDKSSIDEPPKVELKDLPPHPNTPFWSDTTSCPVINCIKTMSSRKKALS